MLLQYFNNEAYEAGRYDEALKKFEEASLKTSTSLALLNFGQNAIFSAAISYAMFLAAQDIAGGNSTFATFYFLVNSIVVEIVFIDHADIKKRVFNKLSGLLTKSINNT